MTHELISIPAEVVESSIILIRNQRVILDRTLARLYGVSTKVLTQTVKRNPTRFPPDFMFQLTMDEIKTLEERLRSHIVTLRKPHRKPTKYTPYAFTEHGISMVSSVLESERAVLVNIEIMRTFIRLREPPASSAELTKRVDALEETYKVFVEAARKPMKLAIPRRKTIGFLANAVKR